MSKTLQERLSAMTDEERQTAESYEQERYSPEGRAQQKKNFSTYIQRERYKSKMYSADPIAQMHEMANEKYMPLVQGKTFQDIYSRIKKNEAKMDVLAGSDDIRDKQEWTRLNRQNTWMKDYTDNQYQATREDYDFLLGEKERELEENEAEIERLTALDNQRYAFNGTRMVEAAPAEYTAEIEALREKSAELEEKIRQIKRNRRTAPSAQPDELTKEEKYLQTVGTWDAAGNFVQTASDEEIQGMIEEAANRMFYSSADSEEYEQANADMRWYENYRLYQGDTPYDVLQKAIAEKEAEKAENERLIEQMTARDISDAPVVVAPNERGYMVEMQVSPYQDEIDRLTEKNRDLDQDISKLRNRSWMQERKEKYTPMMERAQWSGKGDAAESGDDVRSPYREKKWYEAILTGGAKIDTSRMYMTDDEVRAYNYIYNTEGKEEADNYMEWLQYALDERQQAAVYNAVAASTAKHLQNGAGGHQVLSVASNLLSGAGLLDAAGQKLARTVTGSDKPVNYNRPAFTFRSATKGVRDTTYNYLNENYGTVDMGVLGDVGWGEVYNIGMSMMDSAAVLGASAVIGPVATVLLGGAAGTDAMIDARERGASDGEAIVMGVLSGTFETLFEEFSLQSLVKLSSENSLKAILKNMFKQGMTEASEETWTTLANNGADIMLMGDLSGFEAHVEEYKDAGLSDAEARKKAWGDVGAQVLMDSLGGFISGGLMGGGSNVYGVIQSNNAEQLQNVEKQRNIEKLRNIVKELDAEIENNQITGQNEESVIAQIEEMAEKAKQSGQNGGTNALSETDKALEELRADYRAGRISDEEYDARFDAIVEESGQNGESMMNLPPLETSGGQQTDPAQSELQGNANRDTIAEREYQRELERTQRSEPGEQLNLRDAYESVQETLEALKVGDQIAVSDTGTVAYTVVHTSENGVTLSGEAGTLYIPRGTMTQDSVHVAEQLRDGAFAVQKSTDYSFEGYDEKTRKGIYQSNFPKGTPKLAKSQRILELIQNVWSKKPIDLVIQNEDGTTRTIQAQFDPTYSEDENIRTDASKLMAGNRHGTSSEQRVTLDMADDYYQIASEAKYNYSKPETGKDSATHQGVLQWHYFVNDILFQEYGEKEMTPYRVTINVKERNDGQFVYSFNAERQESKKGSSTRRTLHADVNQTAESGKANAQPDINIAQADEKSNRGEETKGAENGRDNVSDGGKRRDAGESTGEQTGELDGRTRTSGRSADAGRTGTVGKNGSQSVRGEIINPKKYGIKSASEGQSARVIPQEDLTEAQHEIAREVYAETELETVFVYGSISIRKLRGTFRARGIRTRTHIIIQVDAANATQEQIAEHEIAHVKLNRNPGMRQRAIERIKDVYTEEEYNRAMERYIRNMRGMATQEETVDDMMERIEDELICDAYAGINIWGAHAENFQAAVNDVFDEYGEGRMEDVQGIRGPPEGQKNTTQEGGEDYSFAEQHIPTYQELIAKQDVKVVDIREETQGSYREQRANFKNSAEAQRICETPVVNKDTGERVFITPETFTHSFSNLGQEQISAVKKIRSIVENAVLTHAEKRTHGADNVTGVYTLFGFVQTETGIQPVKVKIKEYVVEGSRVPKEIQKYFDENGVQNPYASVYDNRVLVVEGVEQSGAVDLSEGIKKEETSSSAAAIAQNDFSDVPATANHPSVSSYKKIADLYDLVNEKYQKYLPPRDDASESKNKEIEQKSTNTQTEAIKQAVREVLAESGIIQTADQVQKGIADDELVLESTEKKFKVPESTDTEDTALQLPGVEEDTNDYSSAEEDLELRLEDGTEESLQRAKEMLAAGETPGAIYGATNWVRLNGGWRYGFDGKTIYDREVNADGSDTRGLDLGDNATGETNRRERGQTGTDGRGNQREGRSNYEKRRYAESTEEQRQQIVDIFDRYFNVQSEEKAELIDSYDDITELYGQIYDDYVKSRVVAEQWYNIVPEINEIMDDLDAMFAAESDLDTDLTLPGVEEYTDSYSMAEEDLELRLEENPYAGKSLTKGSTVYDYDFLTQLHDMDVVQMPPLSDVKTGKNVDQDKAVVLGLKNAAALGTKVKDRTYAVKNSYTGRKIRVSVQGLRHSLDATSVSRLRTNARLSAIAGDIIQNAVPINALRNKNGQASGTYAMACLLKSGNMDVVAIVTVEQHTDQLVEMDFVDITHSINGRLRKKEGSLSSARETGYRNPSAPAAATFKISVADFLGIVKETHQSILSDDVLEHFDETRNPEGYYSGRVLYSTAETEEDLGIRLESLEEENAALRAQLEALRKQNANLRGDTDTHLGEYDGDKTALARERALADQRKAELDMTRAEKKRLESAGRSRSESPLGLDAVKELLNDPEAAQSIDTDADYGFMQLVTDKGISNSKDLGKNLDEAAGGNTRIRKILKELIEKPFYTAKKSYAQNVKRQMTDLYNYVVKECGIKMGSKESAAIQWYGEKTKPGEIVEKQVKNPRGKTVTIRVQEDAAYTLEDLKKEFPKKWQDIVKAERYFRKQYDAYIGRVNAALEEAYPHAGEYEQARYENYLTTERFYKQQAEVFIRAAASVQANIDALTKQREGADTETGAELDVRIAKEQRRLERLRKRQTSFDLIAERAGHRAAHLKAAIDSGEVLKNKRLNPRKDYFHHFQEMDQKFGGLKNLISSPNDIDPRLLGVSEYTKPNSKWTAFLQRRGMGAYKADAIEGFVKYVQSAEYIIHIDPIIAAGRGHVRGMAEATKDTRNANGFINWYTNWINELAGKGTPWDRPLKNMNGGRTVLAGMKWLNGRVKANAVMGNMRSAVAQFFNIPNAMVYVKNPLDWSRGVKLMAEYAANRNGARELLAESGFLTERYLDSALNKFDTGVLNVPRKMATWLLTIGDEISTKYMWAAAYEQAVRKGIADPISHADDVARRAVAGRGIGEVPLTQQSQLVQLIAPFQVEVNNQWQIMKKLVRDMNPHLAKTAEGRKTIAGAASGMVLMSIVSFIMNSLTRLLGFDVSPDFINAIIEAISEWDDEESTLENVFGVVGRLAGEVISNAPMGAQAAQLVISDADTREALFGDSDPTRFGTGNIGIDMLAQPVIDLINGEDFSDSLISALLNIGLPFGGKQAERFVDALQETGILPHVVLNTEEGLDMWRDNASYSTSGNLRFHVDTSDPWNVIKEFLWGAFSTKEGMDYIESGETPLNEEWTAAYREMTEAGADGADAYAMIQDILDADKDVEKYAVIIGSDAPEDAKEAALRKVIGNKEGPLEKLDEVLAAGISVSDYLSYMVGVAGIDGKNANGESVKGLATARKLELLDGMNLTDEQKLELYRVDIASDSAQENLELVLEAGLDEDDAYDLVTALGEINLTDSDTSKTPLKYEAVLETGADDDDMLLMLQLVMEQEQYEKAVSYTSQGVDTADYIDFLAGTWNMEADKDEYGKSISGSKKVKVLDYIDDMDISDMEKDLLYYAAGYKESTIDEAPWR